MKTASQYLCAALMLLASQSSAAQFSQITASEIERRSEIIVMATVTAVQNDLTIPDTMATGYDIVDIVVGMILKGSLSTNDIRIRLATRGMRGFNKALQVGDTGVFFLISADDGLYYPAHPGSIALFMQGYFKPEQ